MKGNRSLARLGELKALLQLLYAKLQSGDITRRDL
jgi:hypothetical protein